MATTASTVDERQARIDCYIYLSAIAEVVEALSDPNVGFPTLDGPPLEGFRGEEWPCRHGVFYDRLAGPEAEILFPTDDPARDGEDDDAYEATFDRSQLLAGRMLARLAGASEFCARAADRKLANVGSNAGVDV